MSLQKELDTLTEGARKHLPAEALDVVDTAHHSLTASKYLAKALGVGAMAPPFRLPDSDGTTVDSTQSIEQGPLVVSFYRGSWCPYCNLELNALQNALPEIEAQGAALVAISPEKPDFSPSLIERNALGFSLLTDSGNEVAHRFGIVFTLDGEYRRINRDVFGVDLPKSNGDESWQLPAPATFIIDTKGVIQFAFIDIEFRRRAEPREILAVLRNLKHAAPITRMPS